MALPVNWSRPIAALCQLDTSVMLICPRQWLLSLFTLVRVYQSAALLECTGRNEFKKEGVKTQGANIKNTAIPSGYYLIHTAVPTARQAVGLEDLFFPVWYLEYWKKKIRSWTDFSLRKKTALTSPFEATIFYSNYSPRYFKPNALSAFTFQRLCEKRKKQKQKAVMLWLHLKSTSISSFRKCV